MKRARQPSPDEQEPSRKHQRQEEVTFGPFAVNITQVWNDFWIATSKFLSSLDLWKLSSVSKTLFDLVWKFLIPNYEEGMIFAEQPQAVVAEYLSRAPSLKSLNFQVFGGYSVLRLLTMLKKLEFLGLPSMGTETQWNQFPFEAISHLTSLTGIGNLPSAEVAIPLFDHFKTLRIIELETFNAYLDLIPIINEKMTQLESLYLDAGEKDSDLLQPRMPSIGNLTRLTELTMLEWYDEEQFDIGLGCLTNLKQLVSHEASHYPRESLQKLRNLTDLTFRDAPHESLDDICSYLTNLTCLDFTLMGGQDFRYPDAAQNFTNLKKLKKVTLGAETLNPTNLAGLQYISNLDIGGAMDHLFNALETAHFPNLTKLRITVDPLSLASQNVKFLGQLTNLKKLEIELEYWDEEENKSEMLLNQVKGLTNLVTLRCVGFFDLGKEYIGLEPLKNLKTLKIRSSEMHFAVQNIINLTGLIRLNLDCAYGCPMAIEGLSHVAMMTNLQFLNLTRSEVFGDYREFCKLDNEDESGGEEGEKSAEDKSRAGSEGGSEEGSSIHEGDSESSDAELGDGPAHRHVWVHGGFEERPTISNQNEAVQLLKPLFALEKLECIVIVGDSTPGDEEVVWPNVMRQFWTDRAKHYKEKNLS